MSFYYLCHSIFGDKIVRVFVFTSETSCPTLWKPNGLSKHLFGLVWTNIGVDLSLRAKLAVIWRILKWCYIVDLIMNLI